jgi:hypothetical protein
VCEKKEILHINICGNVFTINYFEADNELSSFSLRSTRKEPVKDVRETDRQRERQTAGSFDCLGDCVEDRET